MSYPLTMEQIERSLLSSLQRYTQDGPVGQHELVHIRFGPGYLDCKSQLVLEAWEQVKKTIDHCSWGLEDPREHRAEAFLLMLFQEMYYHGYTPSKQA